MSGLILSTGALNPVFDSTITTYTVVVANSIDRVIVTPSATITGATITVNAVAVDSGSDSDDIALPGTPLDIPIVVTADNGNTMMTYTVTVTSAGPLSTATLAGTLTEAGLFATPAPTVTVTLANTEYEAAPGTLLPSHFSVTDTVAGTVSVSDFTRDSDTVATLTLAYSGEDITTTGTLSVTVAAAGHTAAGDLMTNTIAITAAAGAGVNVCGRTAQVRDAIVAASSDAECTSITDLAELFSTNANQLNVQNQGIVSLQSGDFAGLTALVHLRLNDNRLTALPADIFAGLASLEVLRLSNNALEALPATIFDGLTVLRRLRLSDTALTALPATIFDGLDALVELDLTATSYTEDTGLPVGIFDDVLDSLGEFGTDFVVGGNVRGAHFVCSHPDVAAIVASAGITVSPAINRCLRVSSTQFNDFLTRRDAVLSGLTLSDGTDTFPLTPVFASGTTAYTVAVISSVDTVTVTPTATNTGATITVTAAAVTSGSASGPIGLPAGTSLDIPIVVTAAEGANTATYTVTVTRATVAQDASLSGLTLSVGALDPVFAPGTTTYTVSVVNSVDRVTVMPTATNAADGAAGATITVNAAPVASGVASSAIPLSAGVPLDIPIVVTAAEGANTETYTVTVTRAPPAPPIISIAAGASPVTEGTAATFTLTATPAPASDLTVMVTVTGAGDFIDGAAPTSVTINADATTATLTVPTIDDSTVEVPAIMTATVTTGAGYTVDGASNSASVTIRDNDAASIDASLSGLTLSAGALNPVFASGTTTYTVLVANSIDTVTVMPTATNADATITVNAAAVDSGSASDDITLMMEDTPMDIRIIVTAANANTTMTYTVTATRAVPSIISIAAGTSPVTEGTAATFTLTATPAPASDLTVMVRVTGAGDFIADAAPTTVTINAAATTATLTVPTTDDSMDEASATITATVTAGTDYTPHSDDNSASVTVRDDDGTDICSRTVAVRDAILAALTPTPDCTSVSAEELASVTTLSLVDGAVTALQSGDFAGLTSLTMLALNGNALTTLPDDIFAGLTSLATLALNNNGLTTLATGQFTGLPLRDLLLSGNGFTAGTGLPAGIFDDPIATLGSIGTDPASEGFVVDPAVRAAHFVCSRGNAMDVMNIVTAVKAIDSSVTDCLLVTSAQLNAIDAGLSGLTVSGAALTPVFASATTAYTVAFASNVDMVTVTPTATNPSASITVNDDLVPSGSPSVAINLIGPGIPQPISIVVTAADGDTAMTYTVTATSALAVQDASLSGLTLSVGTLDPVFDFATTTYTAAVAGSVDTVTVMPTATNAGATITVNAAAVDSGSASAAITLTAGMPMDIPIVVTAENTIITETYTVTVTRAATPIISIAAGTSPVTEGTAATFTLTATPAPENDLAVVVMVDDGAGDFIDGVAPTTFTINAAATTATLVVPTTDDSAAEATGAITATVAAGTGYTVHSTDNSASVTVQDNDSTNICERTDAVEAAILAAITPTPDCASVPIEQLASVSTLTFGRSDVTELQSGDFAGLTGLTVLSVPGNSGRNRLTMLPDDIFAGLPSLTRLTLSNNALTTLPDDIFAGLTSLSELRLTGNQLNTLSAGQFAGLPALSSLFLDDNALTALPPTIFAGLTLLSNLQLSNNQLNTLSAGQFAGLPALSSLSLNDNALTALPPTIFAGLTLLSDLQLSNNQLNTLSAGQFADLRRLFLLGLRGNSFTAGTGLPAGIFDAVIPLGPIGTDFFVVDQNVRAAHFVCSRADFAAIVTAVAMVDAAVTDCLLVTSAQLNTQIAPSDARLSGLTLTDGALTPVFIPGITTYTVALASSVATLSVTPTATNAAGATITVNGATVTSGSATTANLTAGTPLAISIVVTAEDGMTTMTYTVTATRARVTQDASLSGLTLSTGTLAPGFDFAITSYAVEVANGIDTVTVTPTATNAVGATITVNAAGVDSGSASAAITLTAGTSLDIPIVVTAEDTTTRLTYTVTATRAPTPIISIAAGTSPVTEGTAATFTLTVDTAPESNLTVMVRVTEAGDFIAGAAPTTVTINADTTTATLTVPTADDSTVEATGAITATVAAGIGYAVDGTDNSASVTVQDNESADICERTDAVEAAILAAITPTPDCTSVTPEQLAMVTTLTVGAGTFTALQSGDFAGLSRLTMLSLSGFAPGSMNLDRLASLPDDIFAGLDSLETLALDFNALTTLPDDIFAGLDLRALDLNNNALTALPDDIFAGLTSLTRLSLNNNALTTLPDDIFAGLTLLTTLNLHDQGGAGNDNGLRQLAAGQFTDLSLEFLRLRGNSFTARTGLPAGIFDAVVLDLGNIGTDPNTDAFVVDQNVRAAHFVCSRADAADIVAIVPDGRVTDCLHVTSAQFNTHITPIDATLSGLTLSDGALAPVFTPGTTTYTVAVASSVTSVTVMPTATNDAAGAAGAAITVNAAAVDSGSASAAITLTEDTPVDIPIVVTAADGTTTMTYTVTATRATATRDASLSGLTLSAGVLAPVFDSATTTYTVAVAGNVDTMTVTPTATNDAAGAAGATITVNAAAVTSGSASAAITLTADTPVDIPIVVTAADGTTTMTYTVTATRVAATTPIISIAAGTSPVTEGTAATFTLTVDTVPESNLTVMVRVTDGAGDFIAGAVPTTVTINAATTTAILTVPTTDDSTAEVAGAITATVAAGTDYVPHGTDNSASVTVQDDDGVNICERTMAVRDAILDAISPGPDCMNVTPEQLASVRILDFDAGTFTALESGDFAGLSGLTMLSLPGSSDPNRLTSLPRDIFAGLTSLTSLALDNNGLTTLPRTIFAGLTSLTDLQLNNNQLNALSADQFAGLTSLTDLSLNANALTTLPRTIFAGVTSLERLRLDDNGLTQLAAGQFTGLSRLNSLALPGNPFMAGTGLPAGIFDDVIDTLGPISDDGMIMNSFSVDGTVRAAHFVCSRADAAGIVTLIAVADAAVTDCLLVTSAQLNTQIAPIDARLSGLTLSDGALAPVFTPGTTTYAVAVASNVDMVTVMPTATNAAGATITVDTATVMSGSDSGDITLREGVPRAISIVVTAADTTTTMTYTVTVTPAVGVQDASLSGLTLSDGALAPVFDFAITNYAVEVASSVDTVTVTPTATNAAAGAAGATITVNAAAVDSGSASAAITLTAGTSRDIPIVVTAADTITTMTYTVTVTRALLPNISIAAVTSPVTEGTAATFTLTAIPAPENDLTVMVTVTGAGDFIAGAAPTTVTINAAATTATLTVPTTDDNTAEEPGTITATVTPGTGYTVDGTDNSASVTVQDNDAALRDATLSGLTLSDGTLDPVFDSATTTYAVAVANSVDTLSVTPTATNAADATITVNAAAVTSGSASDAITLPEGTPLDIPIVVTSADGMAMMTYTVTATRAAINICERTMAVRDAILAAITPTPQCEAVTGAALAGITELNLSTMGITSVARSDFAGLDALTNLNLLSNNLGTLDADLFADLSTLVTLILRSTMLTSLPADIFDGLDALETLTLTSNQLVSLPADIFDGLDALESLFLLDNLFTSNTGLPEGVFDDVLNTLSTLTVDDNVREAHFVCSHPDVVAIVDATDSVTDCLRITAAQFNAFLTPRDATLSGLTLSAGALDPVFAPGTTTYAVALASSVDIVTVTPTATNDADATITVNAAAVTSGSASAAITLTAGMSMDIPIVVTAADGTTTMTYTVTATRAEVDQDATLSGLTLSAGALDPMFDFATTTYAVAIANSVTSVTVTPTATNAAAGAAGATITVNAAAVTSGSASAAITLTAGMSLDIPIVVTSADGMTTMTYTVTATRAATPIISIAAGTGTSPVTEGTAATFTLTATPAPESDLTVMVTVTDGAGDFIDGVAPTTVTINAAATATLMVPTIDDSTAEAVGTITATVAAGTGYTVDGTDNSASVAVQDNDGIDICSRTMAVQDAILAAIMPRPDCTSVIPEELASVTTLEFDDGDVTALESGDFAGLSGLTRLSLPGSSDAMNNRLTRLPDDIFAGLTSLSSLALNNNGLTTLPRTIFAGVTSLETLRLDNNDLTQLAVGQFTGLSRLNSLALLGNPFMAGTGLPAGIFDDVIDTLGEIGDDGMRTDGFSVDGTVRAAHFVCSRDDANDIFLVIAVIDSSVTDCLLVTSAQLNTQIAPIDVRLSGLTLSDGTLDPVFTPGTTTYTVAVVSSVTSVTVTPTAINAAATITVDTDATGSADAAIALMEGVPRVIPIVVTAAATTTTMTYTVTVTRATATQDTSLSGLTLSDGALDPVFDSATTDYTVALANSVDTVTVTPTATNAAGATITVNAAAVDQRRRQRRHYPDGRHAAGHSHCRHLRRRHDQADLHGHRHPCGDQYLHRRRDVPGHRGHGGHLHADGEHGSGERPDRHGGGD